MLKYLNNKGFFDLLSVNFLSQFLGFGTLLLVAKFLTPIEFGQIKIIQSYSTLFILLSGFGLNTAVLKYCSENRTQEEKVFILSFALQRTVYATLFSLLLLAILTLTNTITPSPELNLWILIYSIIIPFSVLTNLLIAYLQALKKIKKMARIQAIIKLQSFAIIIFCSWLWGFVGFIISNIASYLLGLLPLLNKTDIHISRPRPLKSVNHSFMSVAFFSFLANFTNIIGQYADIFILDHYSQDRASIGYYSLATIFLLGANQVTGTVQSISTPYFSERAHDEAWFRKMLLKTQLNMTTLSIITALILFCSSGYIINIIYGASHAVTTAYISILLLKFIIYSSCAIIGSSLVGLGLMHYNFAVALISTPVGIISSYYFLLHYGVIGVAWAQVLSSAVTFFLIMILSRFAFSNHFKKISLTP